VKRGGLRQAAVDGRKLDTADEREEEVDKHAAASSTPMTSTPARFVVDEHGFSPYYYIWFC
jgi:hypothetical protein